MSIHEECGVFGIFSDKPVNAAKIACQGLYALQHRGQESCGIVVCKDRIFTSHKDTGLVKEVFTPSVLSYFPEASMAVAHTRYSTTGSASRNNCQPLEVNHQKGRMALAHNGNLSNASKLRSQLELSGAIFHTSSDTEIIAYMITRERLHTDSIENALSKAMEKLDGAYSLILMSPQKIICARDPHGFRPLCYGRTKDGTYIIASETCALTAAGAEPVRDIEPGEILIFSGNGIVSRREHCGKKPARTCIFEYIYFARADSVIDGISVHDARIRAGQILAEVHPVNADAVIGVPDSGLYAALGYSQKSKIPYEMGLIKNEYIGRTFIEPANRTDRVRLKLSAVKEVVKDKRIVLIDDSIVRGITVKRIIDILREAGASEIHMRVSSPPFLHPCYYGTDIDSDDHLIAAHHTIQEIQTMIGADSLGYLPSERLSDLRCSSQYCSACFTSEYPTEIPNETYRNRFENPFPLIQK